MQHRGQSSGCWFLFFVGAIISVSVGGVYEACRTKSEAERLQAQLKTVLSHKSTLAERLREIENAGKAIAPLVVRRLDMLKTLAPPSRPRAEVDADPHVRITVDVLKEAISRVLALQDLETKTKLASAELEGLQEKISVKIATAETLSPEALASFEHEVGKILATYDTIAHEPLDRLPAPRVTDEDIWSMIR